MSGGAWTESPRALPGVVSTNKTAIETEFVSYVEHWFWRENLTGAPARDRGREPGWTPDGGIMQQEG